MSVDYTKLTTEALSKLLSAKRSEALVQEQRHRIIQRISTIVESEVHIPGSVEVGNIIYSVSCDVGKSILKNRSVTCYSITLADSDPTIHDATVFEAYEEGKHLEITTFCYGPWIDQLAKDEEQVKRETLISQLENFELMEEE